MTDRWNRPRTKREVPTDPYLRVEIVDASPSTQTYGDLDRIVLNNTAKQFDGNVLEAARYLRGIGEQLPSQEAGVPRSTIVPSPGKVVRVTRPGAPRFPQGS